MHVDARFLFALPPPFVKIAGGVDICVPSHPPFKSHQWWRNLRALPPPFSRVTSGDARLHQNTCTNLKLRAAGELPYPPCGLRPSL
jgi:hypothetical protein